MPYESLASPEPLTQKDASEIKPPTEKWTNKYAHEILKADFAFAGSYRFNAHDWRYRNADELYLGWTPQRYWDGTRVPRSSIGQYVVFQQIMGMLPKIVPTITSYDNMHFYAPHGQDDDTDLYVQAWKELVQNQLVETKFREQVKRACHSLAQYGNGILEVGVEEVEEEFVSIDHKATPTDHRMMFHPVAGPIPFPSKIKHEFSRKITVEKQLRPYIRYVSVKDFYVDPNLESNILQESRYVFKRIHMTIGDIKRLKGQPGFTIPADDVLALASQAKSTANQDVTKQSAELFRQVNWNPTLDYSSDTAQKRAAVVEYTTKDRKIWWMPGLEGEQGVIYNAPNKYREINYFSSLYADVLDRWIAMSVSDVAEGEHRLQGSIINARIDELALGIHKPMLKRRGVTIPSWQLRRRPGLITEVENPDGDIKEQEVANITQQAYVEVSASDQRVQRTTGMSDLAALGTPSAGGNSANRTAAGINTQSGATDSRIFYLVGTVEDLMIEPAINAVIRYNKKFMDLNRAANWLKLDPRFTQLDPAKVMNCKVIAECRGAGRMAAKQQLLQIFPMLSQTIFNPEFLQTAAQHDHMVISINSLLETLTDAINYSFRNPLFRKMKDDEIKQMQAPPPEAQLKGMLQQNQLQSDEKQNSQRSITKLLDTTLKTMFAHHQKTSQLDADDAQQGNEMKMRLIEALLDFHNNEQQRDADAQQAENQTPGSVQ